MFSGSALRLNQRLFLADHANSLRNTVTGYGCRERDHSVCKHHQIHSSFSSASKSPNRSRFFSQTER